MCNPKLQACDSVNGLNGGTNLRKTGTCGKPFRSLTKLLESFNLKRSLKLNLPNEVHVRRLFLFFFFFGLRHQI